MGGTKEAAGHARVLGHIRDLIEDVMAEAYAAHAKHPDDTVLDPQIWTQYGRLGLLIEEVGEVGRALNDGEPRSAVRAELIQVAHLAMAWASVMDEEDGRAAAPPGHQRWVPGEGFVPAAAMTPPRRPFLSFS